MAASLQIVDECLSRSEAIADMVRAAFTREYGSGDGEVKLVAGLRADGDVAVELAALEAGRVAGHVMFSRIAAEPATLKVAALAPVTARIDRQKSGIGSALIHEGLSRCKALGFDAVAVLGDPGYYKRFGFTYDAARAVESAYDGPAFQVLELRRGAMQAGRWKLTYPRAFASV